MNDLKSNAQPAFASSLVFCASAINMKAEGILKPSLLLYQIAAGFVVTGWHPTATAATGVGLPGCPGFSWDRVNFLSGSWWSSRRTFVGIQSASLQSSKVTAKG